MNKFAMLALVALLALPAMASAQDTTATTTAAASAVFPQNGLIAIGACLGAGLAIIGASLGIGRIGGQAAEATARQPEAGGRIFTSMIISAALIEGATLFAIVVCLLGVLLLP